MVTFLQRTFTSLVHAHAGRTQSAARRPVFRCFAATNRRVSRALGKFMTDDQEKKCHAIIHSHAVAAAAGNAVPVPGLGIAADMVTMTSMTMSLCAVFGGSLTEEAAKALAIATIKNTMLKQPIKTLTKELSKFIPFLGQVVAPSISVVMLEAAGWTLAKELEAKFRAKAA